MAQQTSDTNQPRRILVVDDEETLCEALRFNLEAEGYIVDVAYSAEEALALGPAHYDLILLDIMLDEIDGLQMAHILKRAEVTRNIPIIFLTAKDREDDMIAGLELGADDYITKPYSIRNVLARVKTVLRRAGSAKTVKSDSAAESSTNGNTLTFKGLEVNLDRKTCQVNGSEIKLPRKEFEILATLMSKPGVVFSRDKLLNTVWPGSVIVLDRAIDVHITRLRAKIKPYSGAIVTRQGYGYCFDPNHL